MPSFTPLSSIMVAHLYARCEEQTMSETVLSDEALAIQAVGLLELMSLNSDDTPEKIIELCRRAVTPVGPIAAICVAPRYIGLARDTLDSLQASSIKVVAVINFPSGMPNIDSVKSEASAAIMMGAHELDLVYPSHTEIAGDRKVGQDMVAACKALCGQHVALTVTLETGVIRDPQITRTICRTAIREGANFLKTSNGKQIVSATPQAVRILLEAVADLGGQVGVKPTGNIRTLDEARPYMEMAVARFGAFWLTSGKFRLGATSLLDDVLSRLSLRL